ncbi:sigma-E factor negative regulatory protein [Halomonas sp. PR-M31]|uniref:sigma-E factor negative regulatory protein n=1 Tax=Halomonas sp. PR-M31 TaxID=1471202 RepID=UPI00065027C3|nr:RseA family anti-sigma factor [Halomonas sp. PR-M31]
MKDNCRESLSVLMDNEGDELELRRVLKSLTDRADDSQAWRRYHLVRSLMQRDHSIDVSTDISQRVLASLENEPVPEVSSNDVSMDKTAPQSGSLSFAGSAAVAATVSLMVILGAQFYNGNSSTSTSSDVVSGNDNNGVVDASSEFGSSVQPASISNSRFSSSLDVTTLPSFRPSVAYGNGLREIGFDVDEPMFMAPHAPASLRTEKEQAQLLQHYLERHAEGAAHRSGEAWIPLLRASSQESSSIR